MVEILPAALARRAQVHAALGEPRRLAIVDALTLSDLTPSQLVDLTGTPSNLLAHHLDTLEAAGVVARRRSEGDGRRRYVQLRLRALHGLLQPVPSLAVDSVLFVCTHNAARSQLAAALWRERSPIPVASAGTEPADRVHPRAVEVARQHGLDLRDARPRGYDESLRAALVVSVCDRAGERVAPGDVQRLHWSIADPVPVGRAAAFERAYDELLPRVELLARSVATA